MSRWHESELQHACQLRERRHCGRSRGGRSGGGSSIVFVVDQGRGDAQAHPAMEALTDSHLAYAMRIWQLIDQLRLVVLE